MTIRSRNPLAAPVSSEPERKLRISRAANNDSTTVNEADVAVQLARARYLYD